MEGIHLLYLEINKIFSLSCQPIYNSAKNTARPKFQEMLSYVREGDMIVVHSMDRFARSLKDLVTEVDPLVKRGLSSQQPKGNIKVVSIN